MPPDPNELIHIKHASVKGFGGPVTRQALDEVWSAKGWTEASTDEVAKAEAKATRAALTPATDEKGK